MTRDQLEASTLIGKGNERLCYLHPEDPGRVIKIAYRKYRDQNEIDAIYYAHLEKQGIDFSQLTRCYGWIDIDDLKGLVFERIVNHDGSSPKTLTELVLEGGIDESELDAGLNQLQGYLEKNRIIFGDVSENNILCQQDADGHYRFFIVDGLGTRHLGFKFWMQRHCSPYIRYKLKRQWAKLLRRMDMLQQRAAAQQNAEAKGSR